MACHRFKLSFHGTGTGNLAMAQLQTHVFYIHVWNALQEHSYIKGYFLKHHGNQTQASLAIASGQASCLAWASSEASAEALRWTRIWWSKWVPCMVKWGSPWELSLESWSFTFSHRSMKFRIIIYMKLSFDWGNQKAKCNLKSFPSLHASWSWHPWSSSVHMLGPYGMYIKQMYMYIYRGM